MPASNVFNNAYALLLFKTLSDNSNAHCFRYMRDTSSTRSAILITTTRRPSTKLNVANMGTNRGCGIGSETRPRDKQDDGSIAKIKQQVMVAFA